VNPQIHLRDLGSAFSSPSGRERHCSHQTCSLGGLDANVFLVYLEPMVPGNMFDGCNCSSFVKENLKIEANVVSECTVCYRVVRCLLESS